MNKHKLALAVCCLAVVGLAACGSDQNCRATAARTRTGARHIRAATAATAGDAREPDAVMRQRIAWRAVQTALNSQWRATRR